MRQTGTNPKTKSTEIDQQSASAVYRESMLNLFPYHYVHVIDTNTNITELVVGPKNLRLTKNLKIVGLCDVACRP